MGNHTPSRHFHEAANRQTAWHGEKAGIALYEHNQNTLIRAIVSLRNQEMNIEPIEFQDDFYKGLLAKGMIPGEKDIPTEVLEAMAVLIGRSIAGYIAPTECAGVAALVVAGLRNAGWTVSQSDASPSQNLPNGEGS